MRFVPGYCKRTESASNPKSSKMSRTRSSRSTAFWYSRSSRSNSGHMSSHVPRKLVASSSRIGLRGSGMRPRLMSDAR